LTEKTQKDINGKSVQDTNIKYQNHRRPSITITLAENAGVVTAMRHAAIARCSRRDGTEAGQENQHMAATPEEAGKLGREACRVEKKHIRSQVVSKCQKAKPDHYLRGKRGEGELCSDSVRP
jgi:hypothetical protein